jgi:hypothetical protein
MIKISNKEIEMIFQTISSWMLPLRNPLLISESVWWDILNNIREKVKSIDFLNKEDISNTERVLVFRWINEVIYNVNAVEFKIVTWYDTKSIKKIVIKLKKIYISST